MRAENYCMFYRMRPKENQQTHELPGILEMSAGVEAHAFSRAFSPVISRQSQLDLSEFKPSVLFKEFRASQGYKVSQ